MAVIDSSPRVANGDISVYVASLEVVAEELGVSKEIVRRIEALALRKCRAWAARHGYRVEDLLGPLSRPGCVTLQSGPAPIYDRPSPEDAVDSPINSPH